MLFFSYYVVEKRLKIRSESRKNVQFTFALMMIRGLISGFIITLAVFLTRIGGPIIGGIFAMFPAMFLGTLLITYFSHGASFSSAVMKASILGAVSVVVYGIVARYTFIPFGFWAGTCIAIIFSFCFAFFIHLFLARKVM